METKDFATKTKFEIANNPGISTHNIVAIDVGYSSLKGCSQKYKYQFPSFCKKSSMTRLSFGKENSSDIQYKDEKGDIWLVGESAVDIVGINDTEESGKTLYSRNRFESSLFKIPALVGIALSDPDTKKPFKVITGLPPKFMHDREELISALAGRHIFSVKRGNGTWKDFDITLKENEIEIIPQGMGALFSYTVDATGRFIPNNINLLNEKVLVIDGGMKTFDIIDIDRKNIVDSQTWTNFGMNRVFDEIINAIIKNGGEEISINALQRFLKKGTYIKVNRKEHKREQIPFANILEEKNKKICYEMIEKLNQTYDDLIAYDHLLIAGGTGKAWSEIIYNYYKNAGFDVIITDDPVFSNVRGYYMNGYMSLAASKVR